MRLLIQFSKFLHIFFLHGASLCGFHICFWYHSNPTWNDWDMGKLCIAGVFTPSLNRQLRTHLDRVKPNLFLDHNFFGTTIFWTQNLEARDKAIQSWTVLTYVLYRHTLNPSCYLISCTYFCPSSAWLWISKFWPPRKLPAKCLSFVIRTKVLHKILKDGGHEEEVWLI